MTTKSVIDQDAEGYQELFIRNTYYITTAILFKIIGTDLTNEINQHRQGMYLHMWIHM